MAKIPNEKMFTYEEKSSQDFKNERERFTRICKWGKNTYKQILLKSKVYE